MYNGKNNHWQDENSANDATQFNNEQNDNEGFHVNIPFEEDFLGESIFVSFDETPEGKERTEIRKTALKLGLSFCLLEIIPYVLSYALRYGLIFSGYTVREIQTFISNPSVSAVFQIVATIISFILPFVLVFKIGKYRISDLVSLEKPKEKTFLPFFLIGIGSCILSNIVTNIAGSIFESTGVEYEVNLGNDPQGFFGIMLTILSTVVTAALIEEFICRGIVLGALRKFGDGFAIVMSALLFGLMHRNFVQIPFAFLIGLVLGFIVIKSGSLWPAIAVHAFNNAISVFFTYLPFSENLQNFVYIILMTLILLCGIIGLYLIADRVYLFKIENSGTKNTFLQKTAAFFTSIPIIVFCVYCVLFSFKFFV